jgi:hypothetical protein
MIHTLSKRWKKRLAAANEFCEDSPQLYHAALGFVKGSQLKNRGVVLQEDQMEEDARNETEKTVYGKRKENSPRADGDLYAWW